jgi:hypothetical protein
MPPSGSALFEQWNRKLHYYLGLYFLFFLWLFLLTGLMLNHGRWAWAQAANQRRETRYEQSIRPPIGDTDLARARDLMNQLRLAGEIELPAAAQAPGRFDFNVARPKDASQVRVDFPQRKAAIQHFDNGGWAIFRIFHTFSGSRFNAPDTQRDWVITTVWVTAMDGLAAGLILMVLGSYYMWYRLKRTHELGWLALVAGYASSVMFLIGLFSR